MNYASSIVSGLIKALGGTDDTNTKRVGLHGALTLPPVWYALTKVCGDFGKLPLDIKKKVGKGAENDEQHYGYRLLRERPNKLQSPSVFKEQVLGHAIMFGNGRAAIVRKGSDVTELIPMMPDRSHTIVANGEKYHATYPMKQSNVEMFSDWETHKDGYIWMHDDDVLHIPGFSFNGIEGIGLLDIAQGTFGIGIGSHSHLKTQLKKGFAGKLFFKVPVGQLRDEAKAKEFLKQINEQEGGLENAGKAGMLREGIDITSVGQSNTEAQLMELAKFTRQDIGLLFGIDAMPGDGETSSYNSEEQENLRYQANADRWYVKWEEQCDMKLRTKKQVVSRSHYYKVNRAAMYRTDLATTTTSLGTLITHKVMNPNEARAKLDMNPYEGGDAFENPAITPGPSGAKPEPEKDPATDGGQTQNRLAIDATIRNMIQVEATRIKNMAGKPDFLAKAEKFYNEWSIKFADKLEELGLERGISNIHCDQSEAILVGILSKTEPQNVQKAVENAVKTWGNRVNNLIGGK